jgi:hypothetical protein
VQCETSLNCFAVQLKRSPCKLQKKKMEEKKDYYFAHW